MNSRRYPRTMQEAFGPYATHDLQEKPEPMHPHDRIVMAGCMAAAAALLALTLWGVLWPSTHSSCTFWPAGV